MTIDASNYNLPSGFQMPGGQTAVSDIDGISRFDYGKTGYVAWRFALEARPWKEDKVRKFRLEGADTVPIILFYRDRDNQVPIKLRRKMRFEERTTRQGEPFDKAVPMTLEDLGDENATELDLYELPIGFEDEMFHVAFEQFKQNAQKPGTSIATWRADPGQVATLTALGIYSVEALGNLSEQEFLKKLSQVSPSMRGPYLELHEMAIAYNNRQEGFADITEYANKIQALESNAEQLQERLEAKDEEMQKLLAKIKGYESEALEQDSDEDDEKDVVVKDGVIQEI